VLVKRLLRKHGYSPDKQEKATQTVLEQAEVLSEIWAAPPFFACPVLDRDGKEYRLARELRMPTLVCVKEERSVRREDQTNEFLAEVESDHHTYIRSGCTGAAGSARGL
jgi:hypothetical protein